MGEIVTVMGVPFRGLPALGICVELDGRHARILGYAYSVEHGERELVAQQDIKKIARRYPRHTITDYNGQVAKY